MLGAMNLGDKIKAHRRKAGLTQVASARFVGVHFTSYYRWETGATEPRFDHRVKLAELFGVPVTSLQADKAA